MGKIQIFKFLSWIEIFKGIFREREGYFEISFKLLFLLFKKLS